MTQDERLGPYRLIHPLGEGGMGVVHLAVDPQGRQVAVKVLRGDIAGDDTARRRLAREVETMRRVRSPNIAEVVDADVTGNRPYIVTQYVPGRPLDDVVKEDGPMAGSRLIRVGAGVAKALSVVHAAGVIHRDLKPSNVMMVDDEPILIDFGIAQAVDSTRLTQTGMFIGTPGYLAPEIIEGEEPGPASDIHAWAGTVLYACTGKPPFGSGSLEVVFFNITTGRANLDLAPGPLQPMLRAAFARDPNDRPTAAYLGEQVALLRLDGNGGYDPQVHVDIATAPHGAEVEQAPPADATHVVNLVDIPTDALQDEELPTARVTPGDIPTERVDPGEAPTDALEEHELPTNRVDLGDVPTDRLRPDELPRSSTRAFTGYQAPPPDPRPSRQPPRPSRQPGPIRPPGPAYGLPHGPPAPPYQARPPMYPSAYPRQGPRPAVQPRPSMPPPGYTHGYSPGQQAAVSRTAVYRVLSACLLAIMVCCTIIGPMLVILLAVPVAVLLRAADGAHDQLALLRARQGGSAGSDVFRVIGRQPGELGKALGVTVALMPYGIILALPVTLLLTIFTEIPLPNAMSWGAAVFLWTVTAGPGVEAPKRQLERTLASLLPGRQVAVTAASVLGVITFAVVVLALFTLPATAPDAVWSPLDISSWQQSLRDLREGMKRP